MTNFSAVKRFSQQPATDFRSKKKDEKKKKNLSLQLDHLPVFLYSGVLLVKEKIK
jgi:hypothetical protein